MKKRSEYQFIPNCLVCNQIINYYEKMLEEQNVIIKDLVDEDNCEFDHHGFCQAHGWFGTDPICPHGRAKSFLKRKRRV